MLKHLAVVLAATLLCQSALAGEDEPEPKGKPKQLSYLKFRLIGPAPGGRVARSAGVPGNALIYYVGSAGGGVWKTSDGGSEWKPIFDDEPVSSIGSIAVAPSDPNVIYVGSGEANIRGNVEVGNGIYKSVDGGKTWKHVWKQEGQIGAMIVHPRNPNIAFAAVLGHAFGPNPERGVYRTTDGGKTWQKVLGKNADTGASDVCFDPSNPRIVFAGLWQTRRQPWTFTSGGPGSGLYRSDDSGTTWKQLKGNGLPEGIWGKIGVRVAPSNGQRVYALIEATKGGLFRSDDGGKHWDAVNSGHFLSQRAWYYMTLTIDPKNADVLWVPQVHLLRSIDGGKTFQQVFGPHHGDHHDIWIDPTDPKRMIDSNDGGVDITRDGGETWTSPPLPLAQFYHVAVDNRKPFHVSGPMQDLGTASGPSNSLCKDGISNADWYGVGGGETGFTAFDPDDPEVVYAGEYGGYISRYNHRTRQARNVSIYPYNPSGHGAEDLHYRFQWTAPILASKHRPKTLHHAANVLFRTTDGGEHWTAISPDLTRNDRSRQKWSGGPITGDNTGVEVYDTIFAIAESPKDGDVLWAGSDDGLVHVTRDGGKHWTNVTASIPGMPEWGTVTCIEPSPFETATAYITVDAHKLDDMKPYLFKTTDYGKTWVKLTQGLPTHSPMHVVRVDPKREGLLYAGNDQGLLFSKDDGAHWLDLQLNLPTVSVTDLAIKDNDLVVGTNGRSIWVFDDLTPVRELSSQITAMNAFLLPSRPTVRWRYHSPVDMPVPKAAGENPPEGVILQYWLKEKSKTPLRLEVRDKAGNLVRRLSSKPQPPEFPADDPDVEEKKPKTFVLPNHPGVNRVAWDGRYDAPRRIWKAKVDSGDPKLGPLAVPGTYTVRLEVGGKSFTTTVQLLPDPRVHLPQKALETERDFALRLRDAISQVSDLVGQIRSIRHQLIARDELLKSNPEAASVVQASKELIGKLDRLESKLHNPKAEVTYDILAQRGGAMLYSQLYYLFANLNDSDGPPTQGIREVFAEQSRQLRDLDAQFHRLLGTDMLALSRLARQKDIPDIIVPKATLGAKTPAKARTAEAQR